MIKRQIPLVVAFVMGVVFMVQFFVPNQTSQDLQMWINKWGLIIGGISLLLGVYSLIQFHYTNIRRSVKGWGFSVVLFACFFITLLAGFGPSIINSVFSLPEPVADLEQPKDTTGTPSLEMVFPKGGEFLVAEKTTNIQWVRKGPVSEVKIELSRNGSDGPWEVITDRIPASDGVYTWTISAPVTNVCYARVTSLENPAIQAISKAPFEIAEHLPWYRTSGLEEGSPVFWIFSNSLSPFMATMFSLIGFFIASAAFRAFRARSIEAGFLLLAALIIMLGQIPLGQMLWQGIPDIMVWIFNNPNMAARRAILFGIAMGSIAFSLRIIFGIERAYLGGDQK